MFKKPIQIVSQQGNKSLGTMVNLVWADTYISGMQCAMLQALLQAAPKRFILACVYLLHNWQACNRHEIVFFTAGEHWSNVSRSLFAAQYSDFTCLWISSSSFSEDFRNAPRYFTWSQKCARAPFIKHLMEQVVYILGGKRTPIVLLQLKAISWSSRVSPQMFRRRCSPQIL